MFKKCDSDGERRFLEPTIYGENKSNKTRTLDDAVVEASNHREATYNTQLILKLKSETDLACSSYDAVGTRINFYQFYEFSEPKEHSSAMN